MLQFFVYPSYDAFEPDAVTFVLASGGVNLFISGDTSNGPALSEIANAHPLDYALLAFGRTWYMSEEQMLEAARNLHPKTLLPFHWEFWRNHTGNIPNSLKRNFATARILIFSLLLIGDSIHAAGGKK